MSILLDRDTRVIVQGITGRMARLHTKDMVQYGTNVVGGVVPGPSRMAIGVPLDEGGEMPLDGGDQRVRHVTTLLRGREAGKGPSALD